jgi:GH15 family glucan-1,4-alpha-glucosidase
VIEERETAKLVAGALDATGRRLAYLPAAVLGNGSLLATFSGRGELERLFWPRVDGGQHLGELRLAVRPDGVTHWLDEEPFTWEQRYSDGVSILETRVSGPAGSAELVDVVDVAAPVLARRVSLEGVGQLVVSCRPFLDEGEHFTAAFVDPVSGALVFYRRAVALAVTARPGDCVAEVASPTFPAPPDIVAHRSPVEGVLTLAGHASEVFVAFGSSPDEAVATARAAAEEGFDAIVARRHASDRRLVSRARDGVAATADEMLRDRSLLVLEQLTDRTTGATIAAPELDPTFSHCGGYGFVWPRDLAYVALGLLAGRQRDLVAGALRWLVRTQRPEGVWLQRHWTDGALAPCWSLHQIDETGIVPFAYEAAWRELEDEKLDRELWPSARRAADALCAFRAVDTGLPLPSVDLWEQHDGLHTYSAAAVYGGLRAAAAIAARHQPGLEERYAVAAEEVRAGIERHLWSDEHGRYLRARWSSRADDGGVPLPPDLGPTLPYPNRRIRSADPVDARLDSSLLGLSWPFCAVDPSSPRMQATVAALEEALLQPDGGMLRHEDDDYAGGNVWLLTTLWLGLHYRQIGDLEGWRRCVDYVVARRTALDLLPEQVTAEGKPAWVLPLAWSHAMFLLAVEPELTLVDGGIG